MDRNWMDVGCVLTIQSLRDLIHLLQEYTWASLPGNSCDDELVLFKNSLSSKPSRRSYDDDYRSSRHDAPRRSPSYSPR